MSPFFFTVTLVCEGGPETGKKVMAQCRVMAEDSVAARRQVIGFVGQNSQPTVPEDASEDEAEHIRTHWNRMRVLSIEKAPPEDLAQFNVPNRVPIYWWGWDELTTPDGS